MKISGIFVIFILSVAVKATWFAPILRPVVLSLGAAFAALDLDVEPILDEMKDLVSFKK